MWTTRLQAAIQPDVRRYTRFISRGDPRLTCADGSGDELTQATVLMPYPNTQSLTRVETGIASRPTGWPSRITELRCLLASQCV